MGGRFCGGLVDKPFNRLLYCLLSGLILDASPIGVSDVGLAGPTDDLISPFNSWAIVADYGSSRNEVRPVGFVCIGTGLRSSTLIALGRHVCVGDKGYLRCCSQPKGLEA